ncbi:ATP-binding cassette domain-containing protein [Streptomyces xiaopingdaonensis]|uniref:ATP-binding cassette domain-containing protein n=1 Tax=Streptomyces xiaopingdaonensis TaxID=1565415 RepID=UPI000376D9CA|nr:ABC transporter ATP-binding protein [Streptomyces xiaopingdaonensis]
MAYPSSEILPLLELSGVSRDYGGHQALRSVDLRVASGESVALMGDNGSGKSTLMRIAAGRDRPSTGTAVFDGLPFTEDDASVRARVAVVGDPVSCYPDLTVRQHLLLVAQAHDVPDEERVIADALAEQRLTAHADALPDSLSSGQRQAMLLAAALLRPRDLLLLDEPEQRLDPAARARLAERLTAERRAGTAVLFATHHRQLAETADRVLLLAEGSPVAHGSPDEVLDA